MPLTPKELEERWRTPEGRRRLAAAIHALRRGEGDWQEHLARFRGVEEVGNGRDLRYALLPRIRVKKAGLPAANLTGANLRDANLAGANLAGANLSGAYLPAANLTRANLWRANLTEAIVTDSNLTGARLWHANLTGASLSNTYLIMADLRNAHLTGVDLGRANMTWARLLDANLTGADLTYACLTGANLKGAELTKASLAGTRFGGTDLTAIRFAPDHPVLFDGSDTIQYTARAPWLTWALLRKIGQFPLFGVSWFSFVLSVAAINFIGALNQRMQQVAAHLKDLGGTDAFYHWLQTPIPIPYRMELIVIASILLVIGTTIYKLACPSAVQEFSESQWVAEHHQPRLLYYREMWRRRWLQWPTLVCSVLGAALALFLIIERLVMAFGYMLRQPW